jgi:hypothetical protein
MKLLNFENFNKLTSIQESEENFDLSIEESASLWDAEQILNEGFSSSIMQMLSDSDLKDRWKKGMAADLYKGFGIAISDIQDTDFQLLTDPRLGFERPIKGDDNKIVFFINDDTELRDRWTEWQKGRAPFPFLVAVVRGGVSVWFGYKKEPGYKQGKSERYGILAKEYDAQNYLGLKSSQKVSITQKSIIEFSTKAYVLDLAAIREKYSTLPKQAARKEARKGAVAMISAKNIKSENIERYKRIISEKVGPAETLAKFQTIWTKGINGITTWVNKTKLDDLDVVKNYAEFDFGSWNRQDIGSTLQQLYRSYGEYIRDYVEFCRKQKRIELYADAIETGKNPETGEEISPEKLDSMAKSIEYYRDDLKAYGVKFVEYNQHFDKCDKQITAGVEHLNTLLNADKSKFNLTW